MVDVMDLITLEHLSNFSKLRHWIGKNYKSKLEPIEIYKKIDAEFEKLLNSINRGKITASNYKIITVRVVSYSTTDIGKLILDVSHRNTTFKFRIDINNLAIYNHWVTLSPSDKMDAIKQYKDAYQTLP